MISGFDIQTAPLNAQERRLLPIFINSLMDRVGKDRAVTAREISAYFEAKKVKMGGARVRKIINHIRVKGLVPNLIATSKGYYRSTDPKEVQQYIESLEQRESAIRAVRKSLETSVNSI